jgi:hypothetical protein
MKPNKDFFVECNEGAMMSPPEFERTFCSQCKNRQCVRADWAFSSWDKRILTQVDRLLTNPNIALQSETSRWEGLADFDRFSEPQSIEIWGVPESQTNPEIVEIKEEEDTIPNQPIEPPNIDDDEESVITSAPKITIEPQPVPMPYTNPLNTPPQEITIGETPKPVESKSRPKNFQSDPWAVTETLPVGGKFKMGK